MKRRSLLGLVGALCVATLPAGHAHAEEGVVVIANSSLRGLDTESIRRIYTGRMVELDGMPLRPVQLGAGHPLRRRFLGAFLQQSDEDYIAYWTVRRYIGKGAPPRELGSTSELVTFVQNTPGAIGYIDAAELRPGLHVLMRR